MYHAGLVYSRDFFGNEVLDAATGEQVGTFQSDRAGVRRQDRPVPERQHAPGDDRPPHGLVLHRDGGLVTAPIVVGSTVFVGSSSGMLYGLDLRRGRVVWSTNVGAPILGTDEQNVSQPHTGLGAGQGLLVVPAGTRLVAYGR